MSLITHVPVFSVFGVMVACAPDVDVQPYSFYYVFIENLDPILFPQSWDFVPGLTVTFAREQGIAVQTHGVITPHRLIAISGRAALEALWSNNEVDNYYATGRGARSCHQIDPEHHFGQCK